VVKNGNRYNNLIQGKENKGRREKKDNMGVRGECEMGAVSTTDIPGNLMYCSAL